MGDTNMQSGDELKAFDALYGDLSPHRAAAVNERIEGPPEDQDWTFNDEQQEQYQVKYGDEIFYEPFTPKPPRGSVEDIQHKLRIRHPSLDSFEKAGLTSLSAANARRDVDVCPFC